MLCLTDRNGNDHVYKANDVFSFSMTTCARWFSLTFLACKDLKKFKIFAANPVFFNSTNTAAPNRYWYDLERFDFLCYTCVPAVTGADNCFAMHACTAGMYLSVWDRNHPVLVLEEYREGNNRKKVGRSPPPLSVEKRLVGRHGDWLVFVIVVFVLFLQCLSEVFDVRNFGWCVQADTTRICSARWHYWHQIAAIWDFDRTLQGEHIKNAENAKHDCRWHLCLHASL